MANLPYNVLKKELLDDAHRLYLQLNNPEEIEFINELNTLETLGFNWGETPLAGHENLSLKGFSQFVESISHDFPNWKREYHVFWLCFQDNQMRETYRVVRWYYSEEEYEMNPQLLILFASEHWEWKPQYAVGALVEAYALQQREASHSA